MGSSLSGMKEELTQKFSSVSSEYKLEYTYIHTSLQTIEIAGNPKSVFLKQTIKKLILNDFERQIKQEILNFKRYHNLNRDFKPTQENIDTIKGNLNKIIDKFNRCMYSKRKKVLNKNDFTTSLKFYSNLKTISHKDNFSSFNNLLDFLLELLKNLQNKVEKEKNYYLGIQRTWGETIYAWTFGFLAPAFNWSFYKGMAESYDAFLNTCLIPLSSDICSIICEIDSVKKSFDLLKTKIDNFRLDNFLIDTTDCEIEIKTIESKLNLESVINN